MKIFPIFTGVVEILRNIDNIDFHVLFSGKLCVDEIPRVRRVARVDCNRYPRFLQDIDKYKKTLRHMAWINGLGPKPERKQSIKAKNTPKVTRKRFGDGSGEQRSKGEDSQLSPKLYKVKRTPLTEGLPRITHVTSDIPHSIEDHEVREMEDDIITCPPTNTYAEHSSKKHYQLLGRPKSSPNKMSKDAAKKEDAQPVKRIDWFGLLERKWDE